MEIKELLERKADLNARLKLIPYEGTPEIKEVNGNKYIYMRKRIGSRVNSTYLGPYTDTLYDNAQRWNRDFRALKKEIRHIEKQLAEAGFTSSELSPEVILNMDYARANLKSSIYDQSVLEGVSTTFPQTAAIIDGGVINGMTAEDIQKVLNLKHAWQFILDEDMLSYPTNFAVLSHIATLVNEHFFHDGGRIRELPVKIGGTDWTPSIPDEITVKDTINEIIDGNGSYEDKAIRLFMYTVKAQIFNDGNKRASIIFANHYLISHGAGLMIVPEKHVPEFRKLLVSWYEGTGEDALRIFLRDKCISRLS